METTKLMDGNFHLPKRWEIDWFFLVFSSRQPVQLLPFMDACKRDADELCIYPDRYQPRPDKAADADRHSWTHNRSCGAESGKHRKRAVAG